MLGRSWPPERPIFRWIRAKHADGWDPTGVTAGSRRKLPWRCALDHVWSAAVSDRVSGTDCPYCTGRRALAGFNDLATTHPGLAAEAYDWDPTTRSAGSDRRLRWRCAAGHSPWWSTIENRVKGSGCPSCADYGYNPNRPAWLYFLRHPRWELLQIGITNVPDIRLGQHKRRGWVVLELMGPMDGSLARAPSSRCSRIEVPKSRPSTSLEGLTATQSLGQRSPTQRHPSETSWKVIR